MFLNGFGIGFQYLNTSAFLKKLELCQICYDALHAVELIF